MSNVAQFPGRKAKATLEEAIGQGLEAAKEAGVTRRILFVKLPPGYRYTYDTTEDEEIINKLTETQK